MYENVYLIFVNCYRFKVLDGDVDKTEVTLLSYEEHKEADT